jgi:hypothetical protein
MTETFIKYVHYNPKTKIYSISDGNIYIGFYLFEFTGETEHAVTIKVKNSIITLYKEVEHIHIAIL